MKSFLFSALAILLTFARLPAGQRQISEDRDLKELDLKAWPCLNRAEGSAKTPDGLERNRLKNRPAPDNLPVTSESMDTAAFLKRFTDFEAKTKGKRRKELTPAEKEELDPLEKQIVHFTGYLVAAYCGPPETTNCASLDFHDWHIELFEEPQDHPPQPGDPTPVICEITPRTQSAIYRDNIRIQELTAFFRRPDLTYESTGHKAQKIRVTGYFLWDDEHNGKADVGPTIRYIAANKYHHPWRSAAWEIHPVFKVELADAVTTSPATSTVPAPPSPTVPVASLSPSPESMAIPSPTPQPAALAPTPTPQQFDMPGIASAATSVVIGYVASGTKHIRVGAGGIMLPNHAPLVIAEQFGTLESLYPGRIDLALGRAPGSDQATARALRRYLRSSGDTFPEDLIELMSYFRDASGQRVQAVPGAGLRVPIYLLGSSDFSARLAAELGLPFAFASHFAPDYLQVALDIYRREFKPSPEHAKPYVIVGTGIYASDSDAEARRLFTSAQLQVLSLIRGHPSTLPPPVDNMNDHWTSEERAAIEHRSRYVAVGSPETVRGRLQEFLNETAADEIIATTQIYDHAARLRSFEIAANVFQKL